MTKETKRGAPYPSGHERDEAKLLGPYPTWDAWKHTIESHLNVKLKEMRDSTEAVLKEAYITRRLIQLGKANQDSWLEFIDMIDEDHPGFLDVEENMRIIGFIVDRTESGLVQKKAKDYRRD